MSNTNTDKQVATIKLKRTGVEVLAKPYKGELAAITYANRTQAEKTASKMGPEWRAYQGMGRPFYVTLA